MSAGDNGTGPRSDGHYSCRTYYSNEGRPVETAEIVVPAAHCEIVYEIPINR